MQNRKLTLKLGAAALLIAALPLTVTQALAAEYWLRAAPTTVNMPNPNGVGPDVVVPMWGYAKCTTAFAACTDPVTVPGPALTVPTGDSAGLTVHLRNDLTVPTSLVINGLIKPMAPVWTDGTSGPRGADLSKRVRSFDAEATAGGGSVDYTWPASAVKPGTYLYQSGTQTQVQVQMGLYGAAVVTTAPKSANPISSISKSPPANPTTTVTTAAAHNLAPGDSVLISGVINAAYNGTYTVNTVTSTTFTFTRPGALFPSSGGVATPLASGTAYPGITYDSEATLLYSEIDPALHTAVANGSYGTTGPTSTFNYAPKYFLINGKPYPTSAQVIDPVGNTLLRLLNAGLTTHVPMIQGKDWDIIAEDGKPYTYRKKQYTALLPAAKTLDVLVTPELGGAMYAIMDRRLSLSNAGQSNGGMLAFLRYGSLSSMTGGGAAGNQPPVAVDDPAVLNDPAYATVPRATLNVAAPGVLANDTDATLPPQTIKAVAASGSTACGGTYTLNANGSFMYVPPVTMPSPSAGCTATSDTFTYMATDGQALSLPATVKITVAEPALPGLPVLDPFSGPNATSLGGDWSQATGTVGGANIHIAGTKASAFATNLGGQAIWSTPAFGAKQGAAFTFSGTPDNSALILKATGGTLAEAPANYVRVRYQPTNGGEVVVSTMLGGGNTSMYVNQGAMPASFSTSDTLSAAVDDKGMVTVWKNSTFLGGVQLPNAGVWKGPGKIGIQLHTVGTTVDNFSGGNLP